MNLNKGNTYNLYATIDNLDNIEKIVFAFNNIKKIYLADGTGDVEKVGDKLLIKLSQEETLGFDFLVEYQVAVKYKNDEVVRSYVKSTNALRTIIEEAI